MLNRAYTRIEDRGPSGEPLEVVEVALGGPAAAAGIRGGDLIVSVSGRVITGLDDLHRILAGFPGSRQLVVALIRDGRLLQVPAEPRLGQ
jgi:S1-C subfamily serine protease